MTNHHSPRPQTALDRPRLLILCLALSISLHLLAVLILPLFQQREELKLVQQPTIVRLVDPPQQEKKPEPPKRREFEIDQQPLKPQPETPVESFRKADRDQRVEREQAPKGSDVRDQSVAKPEQAASQPLSVQPQKPAAPPREPVRPQPKPPEQRQPVPDSEKTLDKILQEVAPSAPPQISQPPTPPPILTREQLLPDSRTLSQIASGSAADRNRVKQRDDVEVGDTIWLNLQHDLLVSFFRRFSDQVERVWNYPAEAAVKGIEGTLELLIIVNRQGELIDVDLRQTSGSDILDYEAIQSVYRAAPFGPLTKHYPHEQLKIRAHFRYMITGRYIYGR